MAYHEDLHKAKMNGSSIKNGWYGDSINSNEVILLLENASQSGRHASVRKMANKLIEEMAKQPWNVTAGPHSTDRPGGDKTKHITVNAKGKIYHLRLDKGNQIFEITNPAIERVIRPWTAPGSVASKK